MTSVNMIYSVISMEAWDKSVCIKRCSHFHIYFFLLAQVRLCICGLWASIEVFMTWATFNTSLCYLNTISFGSHVLCGSSKS